LATDRAETGEAEYIIRSMRVGWVTAAAGVLALSVLSTGCSNPFGRKYEYEEQIYLQVDGSATVIVDASIAALIALRNLPFDPPGRSSIDREQIRRFYASSGCGDVRVGQPWTRAGRRFVQIRVEVSSVSALSSCGPLSWSTYTFTRGADGIHYEQTVGAAARRDPGPINWDGSELVAFKLHAPSQIFFHNVRRLEDGTAGKADRGNILTWEQRLADRRAGQPVRMDVRMGADSILYRTLWLFAGAFAAAALALVVIIWMTVRHGRKRRPPAPPSV
jgi:hypothetical protein